MEKKDAKFNEQFNLPDHYNLTENSDKNHPYKLITAPAHNFLNSSFTELEIIRKKEIKPTIKVHPTDLKKLKCLTNEIVFIGNKRGKIRIHIEEF